MTLPPGRHRQKDSDRRTFTIETSGETSYERVREALRGIQLDGDEVTRVRIEIDTVPEASEMTQLTIDEVRERADTDIKSNFEDGRPDRDSERGNDEQSIERENRPTAEEIDQNGDHPDEITVHDKVLSPGTKVRIKKSRSGWHKTDQEVVDIEATDVQRGQVNPTRITHKVHLTKANQSGEKRPQIECHKDGEVRYRPGSASPVPLEDLEIVKDQE